MEQQNFSLAKAVLVLDFLLSKVKVVAFTLNGYFPIYFQKGNEPIIRNQLAH